MHHVAAWWTTPATAFTRRCVPHEADRCDEGHPKDQPRCRSPLQLLCAEIGRMQSRRPEQPTSANRPATWPKSVSGSTVATKIVRPQGEPAPVAMFASSPSRGDEADSRLSAHSPRRASPPARDRSHHRGVGAARRHCRRAYQGVNIDESQSETIAAK